MTLRTLVAMAVGAALAAGIGLAGTASGEVVINGKKHPMNHAYAIYDQDPFDKKKTIVKLLITENPLTEAQVRSDRKLTQKYFDKKFTYIEFRLNKENESSNHGLYSEDMQGNISGSNTPSLFKSEKFTDDRVEGVAEKEEGSTGDTKWSFNVKVAADIWKPVVVAPPTPSDATAAAASEQGKTYMTYMQAMRTGNKAVLKKIVTPDKAAMIDTPDFVKMLPMIQQMTPKQVRMRKLVAGDDGESLLWVTGLEGGKQVKGVITMKKDASDAWRIVRESWGGEW